jgi:hypothetical protein
MNASVLLGIAVLGAYWLAAVLEEKNLRGRRGLELGALLLGGALLTLVNPNGYHVWLYPFTIRQGVAAFDVFEWRSIVAYRHGVQAQVFFLELVLCDAFLIWWLGVRKASRDLALLFVVLGTSVLPFISVRHVAYWPLAVLLPLTTGVSAKLERFLSKFRYETLFWSLVLIASTFALARYLNLPRTYFVGALVPVHAADFIEAQGLKGPRFNLYNEGGYLIWRFWPKDKVFIDGRSEVYPPEVIQEHIDIVKGGEAWARLVDEKYGIDHFLLAYRPEELARNIEPLIRILMERNWVLVYWDDAALIFVRNVPGNKEIIERYGLRHVSPFRPTDDIRPEERVAALAELRRLLALSPDSEFIQRYAQVVYLSGPRTPQ